MLFLQRFLLLLLCFFCAHPGKSSGQEVSLFERKRAQAPLKKDSCVEDYRHIRLALRHIEGTGVGYNQGYTSLEGLFLPRSGTGHGWTPFLDLRGHVFNNGRLAFNGGIGLRYLGVPRIWGVNLYYDYRNTTHQNYNQFAVGLESLGEILDFRINRYIPFGKKETTFGSQGQFYKFEDHYLILSRKRQFAMQGGNLEIGVHVNHWKEAPIYVASGPYFVEGNGETGWGGELRASVDLFDYLKLEGKTSYDNVFKWTGQGLISLNFSLGKKGRVQEKNSSCSSLAMHRRSLQPIDRSEIIPVNTDRQGVKAINPETNLPYFFWFVDNTSNSQGTFESPYPNLWQAEQASEAYDIIYVFSGNGSSYLANSTPTAGGFQLKDHQRLWGSGTSHTLNTQSGYVTIPVFTSAMPLVTSAFNAVGDTGTVIHLGNDCEVAGIYVTGTDLRYGISGGIGVPLQNGTIIDNRIHISRSSSGGITGILIGDSVNRNDGTFVVSNNVISQVLASNGLSRGIQVRPSIGTTTSTISNNQVANVVGTSTSRGVEGSGLASGSHSFSIFNNEISNIGSLSGTSFSLGVFSFSSGSARIESSIFNNQIQNMISGTGETNGIQMYSMATSQATFLAYENQISGVRSTSTFSEGMFLVLENSAQVQGSMFGNTISDVTSGTGTARGIDMTTRNTSNGTFFTYENQISGVSSASSGGIIGRAENSSTMEASILDNVVSAGSIRGIYVTTFSGGSANVCLSLKNNTAPPSIELTNIAGNTFNLDPTNTGNSPSPTQTGTFGSCTP